MSIFPLSLLSVDDYKTLGNFTRECNVLIYSLIQKLEFFQVSYRLFEYGLSFI